MGGCWNVLSLKEDDYLSLLSELKRLNITIAALNEVRRLDGGKIMVGGYIDTIGLVALMVTMPKELLELCSIR